MKINEASRCVGYNERVVEEAYVLTKLLSETGDSSKSGYLDDSITSMSLDEFGNLQFDSYREKEGRRINSTGVVYGDCVLIKQQESVGNRDIIKCILGMFLINVIHIFLLIKKVL